MTVGAVLCVPLSPDSLHVCDASDVPTFKPCIGLSSKQVMYQISARPVPATFPSSEESRAPGVVVDGATVSLQAGIISTWYIQGEQFSCGAVPQMPKSANGLQRGRITTFEVVIASH